MQFKTKIGLVDIPNAEVLAAADAIRGSEAMNAMEDEQRAEYDEYVRRCGGAPISEVKPT